MLSPFVMAQKAINGIPLTAAERDCLTPILLANLASGEHLTLTRAERDKLLPEQLANLAKDGTVVLDVDEFNRFPSGLRFIVETAIRDRP